MNEISKVFSLQGERAVITGGASGIGLAMSKCFSAAGAEVVAVGTRPEAEGARTCGDIGPGVFYKRFDVTETDRTEHFIAGIEEDLGPVTILVNNAGVHCKKPIEDMTDQDFMNVMNVHIMGAFSLSRALIPRMKRRGKGSIIFQASMTSFIGQPNVIAYSCAKSGYLGMVRTLASEGSGHGIRVNAIAPGWIESPMLHKALDGDEARRNKIIGRTPMGKFGQPEDIGWAGVYLASEAAKFVNGVVLPVDGGALIGF